MSGSAAQEQTLGISRYLAVLRRQGRVVIGGVVIGVAAAGAYLVLAPHTVTATTAVNLNVITTDPFNPQRPASGLLDPSTEADIASSHAVAKGASELLDGKLTAAQVHEASRVTASGGASVVRVAFTAPTEKEAVRGADAVAESYLEFRSDQAEQRIDTMLTSMNTRVENLNEALLEANRALVSASPGSTDYAQAASQQQQIQVELDSLLSQRNALTSVDTTGGIVLTSAQDGALERDPSLKMTLATGLGAGLVLGIIAAFVRNPFDRRLRSPADMADALGAAQLADLEPRRGEIDDDEAHEQMRVVLERLRGSGAAPGTVMVFDARRSKDESRALQQLEAAADGSVEFEGFKAGSSRADGLALLRRAGAVLVLCSRRTALAEDLRWLALEADRAGTPVVGFVTEP
ncbi:YveK family protein [Leucobacter tenebrionis]|uniref:hypothetical protein n=1 Tax=Leucobacter tenebrionis TaxID=2873270 RepID=UPI001CA70674|nr:hypothetical protein [Leucobacter tenebrionis]QZY53139.1 hypothetical protein KVY00_06870 [Leucobacter tenebrionis]